MILRGKPLIIVSHPRSGSHFLINSIRQNADNLFGVQKPFFALDSLMVPGDKSLSEKFIKWFNETNDLNKTPVIEVKCLIEDLEHFINKMPKDRLDVQIVDYILKEGIFINLIRDPRECLLSWYKLGKSGGAMAFSSSKLRLANLRYEDFYKLTNIHKLTYKDFEDYDTSTVKYCAYHHYSWHQNVSKKKGLLIYYKDLNGDFLKTLNTIFDFLKKNFNYSKWPEKYVRPPNAYQSRYYRKIGKLIRRFEGVIYSKITRKILRFFFKVEINNLRKIIESAFLSSQLPLVDRDYKANAKTNDQILEHYNEAYKKYSNDLQTKFR